MAQADDDPGAGKGCDLLRRYRFRRHRRQQHGHTLARLDQRCLIRLAHRPDQLRIMRALAADRQMRPLQMQAEEPRYPHVGRPCAGSDGGGRGLRRIGYQRRQQRRGAELRMRPADGLYGFQSRCSLNMNAAAAIDLQVDEARHQHAGARFGDLCRVGRLVALHHRFHEPVAHHHHGIAQPEFAIEDPRRGKGETVAHSVSVTLRRLGGRSGSRPRRTANASTNE